MLLGSRSVQAVSNHLPDSVKGTIRLTFRHDEWRVSKNQCAQSLILYDWFDGSKGRVLEIDLIPVWALSTEID